MFNGIKPKKSITILENDDREVIKLFLKKLKFEHTFYSHFFPVSRRSFSTLLFWDNSVTCKGFSINVIDSKHVFLPADLDPVHFDWKHWTYYKKFRCSIPRRFTGLLLVEKDKVTEQVWMITWQRRNYYSWRKIKYLLKYIKSAAIWIFKLNYI